MTRMSINLHAISTSVNIQTCTFTENIQVQHTTKYKMEQSMQTYWPIRNELAIIDGISIKGKSIMIPFTL